MLDDCLFVYLISILVVPTFFARWRIRKSEDKSAYGDQVWELKTDNIIFNQLQRHNVHIQTVTRIQCATHVM